MRIAFFVLICSMMIWAGCSESDGPSGNGGFVSDDVIVPLAVGNEWRYEIVVGEPGSDTDRVITTTTVDDGLWYVYQLDTSQFLWANNRADGLWVKSPLGPEYLFLKYPAQLGDSYTVLTNVVTVGALLDTVNTPAGRFLCHRYEVESGGTLDLVVYAAPSIGVIRWEEWTGGTPNQIGSARDLSNFVLLAN